MTPVTQILDRVTITGADDSVRPRELKSFQEEFPFVEWGILVSQHKTFPDGAPRFPSPEWLWEICGDPNTPFGRELGPGAGLRLSVHLCGRWVREVCKNEWGWLQPETSSPVIGIITMAQRVQLNFHSYIHKITDRAQLAKKLSYVWPRKQVICQVDGANDDIVSNLYDDGANVAGLYDRSGGAGVLPDAWSPPLKGIYSGYAGGLSPKNVEAQLTIINKLVTDPIWIDVESHVRSEDDQQFDLVKVHDFLERVEPWVINLSCFECGDRATCKFAYDQYNTGGDCLAEK
ncbi:hypothetical protein LCGC14_0399930 [marine sediment metagenome]|uniref:Uncharacterized protein n=1 Tax=marine sediment metagenome TaxID=412755 RepID=A0A0F9TFD3_9ZZZZ